MTGTISGSLVAGIVAGYGIAIPVGAVGTLLVALSSRSGVRVGAAAGIGVATADGLYALVAVGAGASAAELVRPIEHLLRIVAGVVLSALALVGAVTACGSRRTSLAAAPRRSWSLRTAYLMVLGITLLNPTTVIYFIALVLGNTASVAATVPSAIAFVAAVLVASASWQLLLVSGGAILGRRLTGPRGQRATAVVSSVIIAGLAIQVMLG